MSTANGRRRLGVLAPVRCLAFGARSADGFVMQMQDLNNPLSSAATI